RDELARDVRRDGVAEGAHQTDRVAQEASGLHPITDARQDLLLARRTGEVALAGRLPHAGECERLVAVEMVAPGADGEAIRVAVLVIGRIAEPLRDIDVDPAEGVDDAHEAAEVDGRVM